MVQKNKGESDFKRVSECGVFAKPTGAAASVFWCFVIDRLEFPDNIFSPLYPKPSADFSSSYY